MQQETSSAPEQETPHIQVERTPNPATQKFLIDREVSPQAPLAFSSLEEAAPSPFATHLFSVQHVAGVFLGANFISVTKDPDAAWADLEPQVIKAIEEAFNDGLSVWTVNQNTDANTAQPTPQEEERAEAGTIERDIQDLLDERIRPFVARDGGDITFHRFEEGVVYLTLRGACSGCPSASVTLKQGVENLLRHFIPEVQSVEAVT